MRLWEIGFYLTYPRLNLVLAGTGFLIENIFLFAGINLSGFFDFINRHRVEEVMKDLVDRQKQHLAI